MTDRQKFWLKVVLAVTFPLWVAPAIALGAVALIGFLIWSLADDIVESHGRPPSRGGKRCV